MSTSGVSSSHSSNQSSWGIPLEAFLRTRRSLPIRKYPADKVISAINTFVSGEEGCFEDKTLELVLSVVHYPNHLGLLNTNIASSWFAAMRSYTQKYPLFDRSFGILMMQAYGLATMVAFLDHNNLLADFIESNSSLTRHHKIGALPQLVLCTTTLADADIEKRGLTSDAYMAMFGEMPPDSRGSPVFLPSIGGFDFSKAKFLVECIDSSRDTFLTTFRYAADPGWFLLIAMARWQFWYSARQRNSPRDLADGFFTLRDLTMRCWLVSDPLQHRALEFISAEMFDDIANCGIGDEFMDPVDEEDAYLIYYTFMQHISTQPTEIGVFYLVHDVHMLRWVDEMIGVFGLHHLYPTLISGLFGRLWDELYLGRVVYLAVKRQKTTGYCGKQIMKYLADRLDTYSVLSTAPNVNSAIISCLVEFDFVNLMACLLVYSEMEAETDPEGIPGQDIFVSDMHTLIFFSTLKEHSQVLRSRFAAYHEDWLKTLTFVRQSQFGLSTPGTYRPERLSECESAWLQFGEILGYSDTTQGCSYTRCTGARGTTHHEMLVCGACLEPAYCSKNCQQRDWESDLIPHGNTCVNFLQNGVKSAGGAEPSPASA